jgi:hypothetical protein
MPSSPIATALERAGEHTARHTGSLWFPIIGGIFAAIVARLLGITITFFPFLSEGLVRGALDVAVCVVIAYILFFVGVFVWFLAKEWTGRRLNLWLACTVLATLVTLGFLIGYAWDRSRGPIIWTFDVSSPIGWSRSAGESLWIMGFQIKGRNRWDEPVVTTNAYIRSDITAESVPLTFNVNGTRVEASKVTIPPEISFILSSVFPSSDSKKSAGVSMENFLKNFSRFTFVFEYEGGHSTRRFSENEVKKFIALADEQSQRMNTNANPPGVVIRGGN